MRRFVLCVALLVACHSSRGAVGRRDLLASGGPLRPTTPVVLASGEEYPWALAADATHVYWVAGTALRRVAKAGGAPETIAEVQDNKALAVDDTTVYVLGEGQLTALPKNGRGEPRLLLELDGGRGLALDDQFVYVASEFDGRVLRVSKQGGAPQELATGQVRPVAVAVDGTHVYWVTAGNGGGYAPGLRNREEDMPDELQAIDDEGPPPAEILGQVLRVPKAGGAAQVIAAEQFSPTDVAVVGDQVYWSNSRGEAIMRAPVTGGKFRTVFGGRGMALVADAHGVIVRTQSNMIVSAPLLGGPARVLSTAAEQYFDGTLALDEARVYVADPDSGTIVALPRKGGVGVLAWPMRGDATDLVAAGGDVFFVDEATDFEDADAIVRVPSRGGKQRSIARLQGQSEVLVADATTLYVADRDSGTIAAVPLAGGAARTIRQGDPESGETSVGSLTADATHLYWTDGTTVLRMAKTGGPVQPIANDLPGVAFLAVDDQFVYCTSYDDSALRRVPKAGGASFVLVTDDVGAPSVLAVDATGVVYFARGAGLSRVPLAGGPIERLWRIPADADLDAWEVILSGGFAYVMVADFDHSDAVWRIPLAGGSPELLVNGLSRPVGFDVDATGVYVGSRGHDVVFRIDR